MSIKVAIRHQMCYEYDRSVNLSPHTFRLRPAPHCRTPILSYSLKIKPYNHFINWQQDPFGNMLARVVFPEKTTKLHFEVEVIADNQLKKELLPYFEVTDNGPLLQQWVKSIDVSQKKSIINFLVELKPDGLEKHAIHRAIRTWRSDV